jgi:dTDP-glucose 4,6-dehydratase
MNLLITGGAGFIGTNLIHQIIDRPEVERLVNLDCLTYAGHQENLAAVAAHSRYVFEPIDLRNKAAVFDAVERHAITHVLHLAAESHVDRSIAGPDDFIHTNIVGTFNLLEACRRLWSAPHSAFRAPISGCRILHASTDEVFGSLGPTGSFNEASPYAPNSPYSASKAASDLLVRAHHQTYDLPTLVTHGSNCFGPWQFPEKLIPVTIQCALAGQPIPVYGDGLNVRDWLDVRDHVEALWQVLTRGRVGETYNVGGNNECANLPLIQRLCDLIDELAPQPGGPSRRRITFVPDRPGHDRRYAIDSGKLRRELDWAPARVFDRSLRETVRWYLDHQPWVRQVTRTPESRDHEHLPS